MVFIRREIRSLSQEAQNAFVETIKILRNTTQGEGVKKYGAAYRSYDYLTVKHAVSALHKCGDQGHTAINQLTFHRALTAEFERSLMSVIRRDFPSSGLEGVPYWNWFMDSFHEEEEASDWTSSSLWNIWGSPFGDPENGFEILDPVFNTYVPNITNPHISSHLPDSLKRQGFMPVSTHGFYRSPWSTSTAGRITRNPGWVFGKEISSSKLWKRGSRSCYQEADFVHFGRCMQGIGISAPGGADIGPHNLPHVSTGTVDDELFSYSLFVPLWAFIVALIVFLHCSYKISCKAAIREERGNSNGPQPKPRAACGIMGTIFIYSGLAILASVWLLFSTLGLQGTVQYSDLRATLMGRSTHGFTATEWRNGLLECPEQPDCWKSHEFCSELVPGQPRGCNLVPKGIGGFGGILSPLLKMDQGFVGTDYWDGVYSINENFFFTVHAFYDMILTRWVHKNYCQGGGCDDDGRSLRKERVVDALGFPRERVGRCIGSKSSDPVSEEMCFVSEDVGLNVTSPDDVKRCIDHADVLAMDGLYLYDRLHEEYSWVATEPGKRDCPSADELCGEGNNGTTAEYIGSVDCVLNTGTDSMLFPFGRKVVDSSICETVLGEKPKPPVRVCSCGMETVRSRNFAWRKQVKQSQINRQMWISLVGVIMMVFGTYIHRMARDSHGQLRYEMLDVT